MPLNIDYENKEQLACNQECGKDIMDMKIE
jgi:hypothetical protein